VRLFVRALRGAEAGERVAILLSNLFQAERGELERFFPARLAEHFGPVCRIGLEMRGLREARPADQRLGQALRMRRVVEAVAALDAQAVVVGRAVLAVDE